MQVILAASLLVSCAAIAACSSSSSPLPVNVDAGNGDGGHPLPTSDSGNPLPGADGAVLAKPYAGSVTASFDQTANSFTLFAVFFSSPPSSAPCAGGTKMGACCYTPQSAIQGTPQLPASAGDIRISQAGGATLTLTFAVPADAGAAAGAYSSSMASWAPGDALQVSAAGATVHAFAGTLRTVAAFTNVVPPIDTGMAGSTLLDESKDFTVSWSADSHVGEQDTLVLLPLASSGSADGLVVCSAKDSAATMTIPSGILTKIAKTDTAFLNLTRVLDTPVTDDNASVSLSSSTVISGRATFM